MELYFLHSVPSPDLISALAQGSVSGVVKQQKCDKYLSAACVHPSCGQSK